MYHDLFVSSRYKLDHIPHICLRVLSWFCNRQYCPNMCNIATCTTWLFHMMYIDTCILTRRLGAFDMHSVSHFSLFGCGIIYFIFYHNRWAHVSPLILSAAAGTSTKQLCSENTNGFSYIIIFLLCDMFAYSESIVGLELVLYYVMCAYLMNMCTRTGSMLCTLKDTYVYVRVTWSVTVGHMNVLNDTLLPTAERCITSCGTQGCTLGRTFTLP
jgi:hypothetical protein